MEQIGPLVGERTMQGFLGGWGGQDKGIRNSGYECPRTLAICYLEIPVTGPRCWATTRANRYSRTDEAAEGMKNHDFSVFEYRREFVAAGIASNLKIEVQR
jgi:hypothetical protein